MIEEGRPLFVQIAEGMDHELMGMLRAFCT